MPQKPQTQKQQQKQKQQKKQSSPLVKLCASIGLLSLIPLLIVIIIVHIIKSLTTKPKFVRIEAIVVEDLFGSPSTIPTGSSTVEFTFKDIKSRRRISIDHPVKINDKIFVHVINDDPTNIQFQEPKDISFILNIILSFLYISFFLTILLYRVYPSLLCALVMINITMIIVSIIFATKK